MKLTNRLKVISCLLLFAACKKDSNENEALSPRGQMLVAGIWQQSGGTATVNYMGKDTTIDTYSQMDECDKDDFVIFAADCKVSIDENTNKCPDDQQIETSNWTLQDNDTKILLADDNPDTYDLEISDTEMKLKITKPNSSGAPVLYVDIYKNIK